MHIHTQIVVEEFLEDINNMLNSGEVPNLFPPDEYEKIIAAVRPKAKEHGIAEGDRSAKSIICYGLQFYMEELRKRNRF